MRLPDVDVFYVDPRHDAIDARLRNWAAWARGRPHYATSPMFRRLGVRSNGRQWHPPEVRESIDIIDAAAIERTLRELPRVHADALRWWYVHASPARAYCRKRGYSMGFLRRLCDDARTMLTNRLRDHYNPRSLSAYA